MTNDSSLPFEPPSIESAHSGQSSSRASPLTQISSNPSSAIGPCRSTTPDFDEAFARLIHDGALLTSKAADYGALWVKANLLELQRLQAASRGGASDANVSRSLDELHAKLSKDFFDISLRAEQLERAVRGSTAMASPNPKTGGEKPTEEESQAIHATLVRLGLLTTTASLPQVDRLLSGISGKSRVFELYLQGHGEGRSIIAKFDLPDRARDEWQAIQMLRRLNIPAETMLPHPHNRPADGVIIYSVAQAGGLRRNLSCAQFLCDTAATSTRNAVRCLKMALEPLQYFYDIESGSVEERDNSGVLMKWRSYYGWVLSRDERVKLAKEVLDVDWDTEPNVKLAGNEPLPNPLIDLDNRLDKETGPLRISRVHGDLNLTNILIWPDGDQTPSRINIIDLATSEPYQPTATDLVQLEVAIWSEVFSELVVREKWDTELSLAEFRDICDFLDGRSPTMPHARLPFAQCILVLIYYIRRCAMRVLQSTHRSYLLSDYYHCLYFRSLCALRHVRETTKLYQRRLFLAGASMALMTINDLRRGAYSPGANQPLLSPVREIAELEVFC